MQGAIKTIGALAILWAVVAETPGGAEHILDIGLRDNKLSLGSLVPDFSQATFWVILFYGFFMNLNNFGMDQNYVQRYHTAASEKEAKNSIWLCVCLYVPVSPVFFILGTCLYAYYQSTPGMLEAVQWQVARERLPGASTVEISALASTFTAADIGDKVMPHFMVAKVPTGLVGLIIAAIMSASMSTISSGMNASATVFSVDIFRRHFRPGLTGKQHLKVLYIATTCFGLLGMLAGISMIGIRSVLDVWWELSGIFAGGMLGLFLLGIISRQTRNTEAVTATLIGLVVIVWMSLSRYIPESLAFLRSPFHNNMIIVIGTWALFLAGVILTRFRRKSKVAD